MDHQLQQEFRNFWDKFRERRPGFRQNKLARLLRVRDAVVAHWREGKHAISPTKLSTFLELQDEEMRLQPHEAKELIRLSLRRLGYSETSLPQIGALLQPPQEKIKPILAFSPLYSENTSFHSKILQIFTERAMQFNYRVLSQSVPTEAKLSLHEYYPDLAQVSGVVAIACHIAGSNWLEACQEANVPLVLIHDSTEESQLQNMGKVSAIWEDLNGLRDLVTHLIHSHNCKNIRIVAANPTERYHRLRKINRIRDVAAEYGVNVDEEHVIPISQYTYEAGLNLAMDKIVPNKEIDAAITFYDEVALAIWETAKRNGRQNLIVTGYDDIDPAEHLGITSISQKRAARANQAFMEILQAQSSDSSDYPHIHWMKTSLKRRASCGCYSA